MRSDYGRGNWRDIKNIVRSRATVEYTDCGVECLLSNRRGLVACRRDGVSMMPYLNSEYARRHSRSTAAAASTSPDVELGHASTCVSFTSRTPAGCSS